MSYLVSSFTFGDILGGANLKVVKYSIYTNIPIYTLPNMGLFLIDTDFTKAQGPLSDLN